MTTINALDHIGTGFPPNEGEQLAQELLKHELDWAALKIDLRKCAPALLISAFFNGFLQYIATASAERLEAAKNIEWLVDFDFQGQNIQQWVENFSPQQPVS